MAVDFLQDFFQTNVQKINQLFTDPANSIFLHYRQFQMYDHHASWGKYLELKNPEKIWQVIGNEYQAATKNVVPGTKLANTINGFFFGAALETGDRKTLTTILQQPTDITQDKTGVADISFIFPYGKENEFPEYFDFFFALAQNKKDFCRQDPAYFFWHLSKTSSESKKKMARDFIWQKEKLKNNSPMYKISCLFSLGYDPRTVEFAQKIVKEKAYLDKTKHKLFFAALEYLTQQKNNLHKKDHNRPNKA